MSIFFWIVAALLLAALAVRLVRSPSRPPADPGGIDREELDAAEREVRDLDALTSPEEANEQMPDWGPGAPR